MAPPVVVSQLRKVYEGTVALAGISFAVEEGEVFSLLGPNGAGKTTTVEILEGYRSQTSGHVSVLGQDPGSRGEQLRDRIGIMLQEAGIEPQLRVTEAVQLYGHSYTSPLPVEEVLDTVGLSDHAAAPVRALSGGNKRRLDLALALVGDPDVLFLDEPTTGFDPAARRRAWDLISGLRKLGKTILLTTHYLEEAHRLADRVAVLVAGSIVAEGPPEELIGDESTIAFRLPSGAGLPPLEVRPSADGWYVYRSDDLVGDLNLLTGWALEHSIALEGLEVRRPSLEEFYLGLVEDR